MAFFQDIRTWWQTSASRPAGAIYTEDRYPLSRLVQRVLSRVNCADAYVASLKQWTASGTVVYALKHQSQLNSLILSQLSINKGIPRPVLAWDINMVAWQPFSVAAGVACRSLLRFFQKKTEESPPAALLRETVQSGQSAIVHLGGFELFENPAVDRALATLVETRRDMNCPLFVVPVLVAYGRRRDKEHESIFNILFGQTDSTGVLRRFITFLRYANHALVIFGEPVEIGKFAADRPGAAGRDLVQDLRRVLIERIDEEKETTVGPTLKSRSELMRMTLQDERLQEKIRALAGERKAPVASVEKEAVRYVKEIAAGYSDMLVTAWFRLLSFVWNNIYDGMVLDEEGLLRVRNLSRRMPFVIVPCHRSHLDYLILSYVFYRYNIQMPFVAAGINMAFWPFGRLFRMSGAFFLRRTFRGNALYAEVMTRYIYTLLKEGLPIEFFIEGGRSRTGKMVMPKYGLLAMIIQAYREHACGDLAAIPVAVGYDRVVEEKSYLQELGGGKKKAERVTDVIKSSQILRRRYGRAYMNIGEPILLKSYLAAQPKALEEMTTTERQSLYRKIGYQLVLNINKVSVVTPFALVAAGLLSHDRRGISHGELMAVLEEFHDCLLDGQVRCAETLAHRERAVTDALRLYEQAGWIVRIGGDEEEGEEPEETVYSLEDEKRLSIEYYKNNILHYFLPLSFLATAVMPSADDTVPVGRIREEYGFLKRLFWHEFIFDDTVTDEAVVEQALSYLERRALIVRRASQGQPAIVLTGRARRILAAYAGLLRNYLESYWIILRSCAYLRNKPLSERDWLRKIQRQGARMFRTGEVRRAEALSELTYRNAILFLAEGELLRVGKGPDKKDERETKLYGLTEHRISLETLRRRLFRLL